MSKCKANPCCSDPYQCVIPLPQLRSGLYYLNEYKEEDEKPRHYDRNGYCDNPARGY